MVRATRFAILLLAAFWLSACAESPDNGVRPNFADGSSGENATLSAQPSIACRAVAMANPAISGESFSVAVAFSGGTAPYSVGTVTGLPASGGTVTGSITVSNLSQVTRRLSVRDSRGLTGSCSFSVIVQP
jgi:hypothetical protein